MWFFSVSRINVSADVAGFFFYYLFALFCFLQPFQEYQ